PRGPRVPGPTRKQKQPLRSATRKARASSSSAAASSHAVTDAEGRTLGRIEKLTQSYGFIRKVGARLEAIKSGDESGGRRPPSLFFHYTNLDRQTREDDLRVGDAIWFRGGNDGRSGKPTAVDVGATRDAEDRARSVEREERAKRLEAFLRVGHGIIVFPGGVGTTEEILYLLGVLLHPDNADMPLPVVFTGPASSADYFRQVDAFIRATLGDQAAQRYQIIIDDPEAVALAMCVGIDRLTLFRRDNDDAFYFNWRLNIPLEFQQPFEPTHEAMASLDLSPNQPVHQLAANLRRAFSGIVAGNVKEQGIHAIEQHGPYRLHAPGELMTHLDELLKAFVEQHRMKLPGSHYEPCYALVS
ncbi:MAG: pyrimidine/purine nucleotide monophosphate nucleosidase domain-containing protein, partial [Alcanivorax sp.]